MAKVINKKKLVAKTDYDIPMFSVKSAMIIILAGTISSLFVPFILGFIGIDRNISIVIGNALILGFALSYTRFFVETKRGFCKKFWNTYAGFGVAFGVISFFWMYLQTYI
ncbi:hypothetical protein ACQPU1_11305 [Clostridium paraputrificum]|uniref:hypothetical protein n=1 Tax=Clostridium TaxID=1485 RepID=UPI003D32E9BF